MGDQPVTGPLPTLATNSQKHPSLAKLVDVSDRAALWHTHECSEYLFAWIFTNGLYAVGYWPAFT
jgi:hypothetical protein